MNKNFFIIEGKNKAIYIINIKDIKNSLSFYKSKTKIQKIKKFLFSIYLYMLPMINKSKLKTKEEIENFLNSLTNNIIKDYYIDNNSSILVSPTKDKIIINNNNLFQKFAFGESYNNVKNEANIYGLFKKPLRFFQISKFYDFYDNGEYCSFKLSNNESYTDNNDIVLALVELFNITRKNNVNLIKYLEQKLSKYKSLNIKCEKIIQNIIKNILKSNQNIFISTGLVHKDFKHWNITSNKKGGLLIYDFEEAVIDGLPLEDLLNYYIDPIIRYFPSKKVKNIIFDKKNIQTYNRYLRLININIDFKVLLFVYLIERVYFWADKKDFQTSNKYCELLNIIYEEEN